MQQTLGRRPAMRAWAARACCHHAACAHAPMHPACGAGARTARLYGRSIACSKPAYLLEGDELFFVPVLDDGCFPLRHAEQARPGTQNVQRLCWPSYVLRLEHVHTAVSAVCG